MQSWKVVVGTARLVGALGAVGALGTLIACAPPTTGIQPELLLIGASRAPVSPCPTESTVMSVGLDVNGNGWLDPQEPSLHQEHCGLPLQLRMAEAPGQARCPAGGVWVHWGAGLGRQLWCQTGGAALQPVSAALDEPFMSPRGQERLVTVDTDPQGLCPVTGRRVSSGLDTNRNGQLEATEILLVQHLCGAEEPERVWAERADPSEPSAAQAMAPQPPRWALPSDVPVGQVLQVQGPPGLAWRVAQQPGHRIATRSLLEVPEALRWPNTSPWQRLTPPAATGTPLGEPAAAQSADGRQLLLADRRGLWLSHDGGRAWQATGPDASLRWTSVSGSADGRRLLASALADGLYGSDDHGQTWTRRSRGHGHGELASDAEGRTVLAVRHGTQLWLSRDGGHAWQPLPLQGRWRAMAVSADGQRLAAAADGQALMLSHDAGHHWHASLPAPAGASVVNSLAFSRDGKTLLASAAQAGSQGGSPTGSPTGSRDRSHAGAALQLSVDGGQHWQPVPLPASVRSARSVAVGAAGRRWLLAADDGSTWVTHDQGQQWHRQALPTAVSQVLITHEGLHQLALGDTGGVYRMSAATTPGPSGGLWVQGGDDVQRQPGSTPGAVKPMASSISLRHVGTGVWTVQAEHAAVHAH